MIIKWLLRLVTHGPKAVGSREGQDGVKYFDQHGLEYENPRKTDWALAEAATAGESRGARFVNSRSK